MADKRTTAPTAGPWCCAYNALGELALFGPDGRHLLSAEPENALPLEERLANGRLMATSPALLEACQAAAAAAHRPDCPAAQGPGAPEDICACYVGKARRAVALALGEIARGPEPGAV